VKIVANKKGPEVGGLITKFKNSEQMISMVMGILVVLVVGGLAYRYFQNKEVVTEKGIQAELEATAEEKEAEVSLPIVHKIVKGENLWGIAERYFNSGYNWVDIAKENNLRSPDVIFEGQELKIPNVEFKERTIAELPRTGIDETTISGDQYTVKEGDSLSKIAQRAYDDLYEWPEIWSVNRDKISNPNLIFPGQELKIPR